MLRLFDIYFSRNHIQILVNLILRLIERNAHQHEKVLDFKFGVMLHSRTPGLVQPGGIHIHLHLARYVDMGLTA